MPSVMCDRRSLAAVALRIAAIALCGLVVSLTACVSAEPRAPLPLQEAPPFTQSGTAPLQEEWWLAFDDTHLNRSIERALTENFSLEAAWERLIEARAIARRRQADLYPQLDGVADADFRDGSNVDNEDDTRYRLGLEASYEVDLWGRIESQVEAERLRASATAADYQTAAISLSAEVALTWYQLAEARLQLDLVNSQIETNETVLEVLEQRFAVGQSGSADVLRQRQLVEATQEQAIIVRAQISVLEHLLAVLEGRPPQAPEDIPQAALPVIPPTPSTGLPSELLQRRPDVFSALLLLKAADEDVAAAVSDQYPRLNLTASLSTEGRNPSDLFEDWLATFAGRLVAPLLDGGRRRAEIERTEAVSRQRLALYGQTVLVAFREVEDALSLEAHQILRIGSLESQLALARSTSQQLGAQYLNGATDYLDVLAALREEQQLERTLLAAQLERISFRIALYRALAGGFETPRETYTTRMNEQQDTRDGDDVRG